MDTTIKILELVNTVVCVSVGLVGNGLAFIVAKRSKELKKYTISIYIQCLALYDIGFLISLPIETNWGEPKTSFSKSMCLLIGNGFYVMPALEAWTLVNMSLERLTAVLFPLRVRILFSQKRAQIGLIISWLPMFGVYIANCVFTFMSMKDHHEKYENKSFIPRMCNEYTLGQYSFREAKIWFYMDFVLGCALPFLFLATTGTLIVYKAGKINKKQTMMGVGRKLPVSRMTIMMAVVALSFLLLTCPWRMVILWNFVSQDSNVLSTKVAYILKLLWPWNFVINFYIYCVSNTLFRGELKVFLKKWFCRA